MTFDEGLISTWRLPRFSAFAMERRASLRTETRILLRGQCAESTSQMGGDAKKQMGSQAKAEMMGLLARRRPKRFCGLYTPRVYTQLRPKPQTKNLSAASDLRSAQPLVAAAGHGRYRGGRFSGRVKPGSLISAINFLRQNIGPRLTAHQNDQHGKPEVANAAYARTCD